MAKYRKQRTARRRPRPHLRLAAGACLALALASLVLPFAPAFDPWGWLIWGREVLALDLDTSAGPAWKPLPVMLTTAFALAGDAAEGLWLVAARTGWLLSFVVAYRLAARLVPPAGARAERGLARAAGPSAGGIARAAGPLAGGVAALGLLLIDDPDTPWVRHFALGLSEPLAVLASLLALDRHLEGRGGQAVGLGAAAALLRPEAWPLVLAYAAHRAWRERSTAAGAALVAVVVAVPALWLIPDLIGSGSALTGGDRARVGPVAAGANDALARVGGVLGSAAGMVAAPLWAAAAAAVVLAATVPRRAGGHREERARDRTILALAAAMLAWVAVVAAQTALGYAGLARFLLPAGAAACVLAGVGVGRLLVSGGAGAFFGKSRRTVRRDLPTFAASARARRRRPGWPSPGRALAALLVAAIAVAAAGRASALPGQLAEAARHSADQAELRQAVAAAGGARLADCGTLSVAEGLLGPPLAWEVGVPLREVTRLSPPSGPGPSGPAVVAVRLGSKAAAALSGARRLSASGDWTIVAIGCPALADDTGGHRPPPAGHAGGHPVGLDGDARGHPPPPAT